MKYGEVVQFDPIESWIAVELPRVRGLYFGASFPSRVPLVLLSLPIPHHQQSQHTEVGVWLGTSHLSFVSGTSCE